MSMSRNSRVLVISDQSVSFPLPEHWETINVFYNFTHEVSPNGFAAWETSPLHFSVADSCRPLAGGFALQALNRPLMQLALKQPVDAVLVIGLYGCTLDLPRIFSFLKVPVAWAFQPGAEHQWNSTDRFTRPWFDHALSVTDLLWCSGPGGWLSDRVPCTDTGEFISRLDSAIGKREGAAGSTYDYSLYEFGLRDHPLLSAMQAPDVRHFESCQRVLDLGCGCGIFLSLLEQQGIEAWGVERNEPIAAYARGMGLNVITADAVAFAADTDLRFEGIYCSHFVEHLPVELVEKLLASLARIVVEGGTVVLTFPDPESIRSQLLGFWRDPEHVRFYHPELIISLASAVGLELCWSSYDEQPHEVVSFPVNPRPLPVFTPPEGDAVTVEIRQGTLFERILGRLLPGLAHCNQTLNSLRQQLNIQSARIEHQEAVLQELTERTEKLWDISKTWAWNDNVTLKFKRRTQ